VSALLALALLAAPADTLVVGIPADPVTLDPHRATDLISSAVIANVCETLVRQGASGSHTEAGLATTWSSRDGRTWTFTLREGVRFHDGTPFDADAVVANLEALRVEQGFPGHGERAGPYVAVVVLDRPNAALLATLSQPSHALQSPGALGPGHGARPVGTGPFRFAGSRPGRVELEANAGYWGGAPRLARVVFQRHADEGALADALLAGEVDVTAALGLGRVEAVRQSPEVVLDARTGLNIAFLSLNNQRPPFSDLRVRQAIARAVDREQLIAQVLESHGLPARNPLPPSLFGYAARTKDLVLDRPSARRLLAEAGHPDGFEATLLMVAAARPYMPSPLRLADRIREDLGQVGIRLKPVQAPSWGDYVGRGSKGDYDVMVLGWQADTTDPNDFLSALLASSAIGSTNRSRYSSAAMDALLKRGRMVGDAQERSVVYREAQELFQKDMPWVPLYHASVFTAYRKGVRDLSTGPTGTLRYDKAWKAPSS
jgi:peptide/nickel transport system substrate-binding protein